MPQYQEISPNVNPLNQAIGNFGRGFASNLQNAREQKRKNDQLDEILGAQQRTQETIQNSDQKQSTDQNNIQAILNNVSNHPDILAKQGIVSGQNPQNTRNNRLTPEKIARIEAISPDVAKVLKPVYESQSKKEQEQNKADVKRSSEFLTKVDQTREGIPRKQLALRQINEALTNYGKLDSVASQIADATGLETLRTAKGAVLATGTKEFFLSDLSSIPGVRANQFLERALSSAMTDPRRLKEANQMVAAGMKSNLMLDEAKTKITADVEDYYRKTLGYVPATISKDVNKILAPYAQQIQDSWANDVQNIIESNNPKIQEYKKASKDSNDEQRKFAAKNVTLKKAIPGSILSDTMGLILLDKYDDNEEKALKAAQELGYKIPIPGE